MVLTFSENARRLGIASAVGTVLFTAAYAVALVAGLLTLRSPQEPIADPLFSILECLIILMMPTIVALMVAVHAWAPPEVKAFSLLAIIFMSLVAGLTCEVHFVILTVAGHLASAGLVDAPMLFSFRWPSVVYSLDVLGWDVFFALSVFFAAPVFHGSRIASSIRVLLIVSGILAVAGLSGVAVGDLRLRNIGILGYVGVFPIAALLLAILFYRSPVRVTPSS